MLQYGEPTISKDQIKKVTNVLKRKYITQGKEVKKFEEELAKKLGCKYSIVVSSGTAALFLAGKSLNWKSGDIVICSPITFVASCNTIIYNGATPYFVDINPLNNNIDIENLEHHIKQLQKKRKKVKAVVITEIGGSLADWKKLNKLKKKYKFQIVNDKCHSIGSRYNKSVSYSTHYCDIATLSFHAVKHITTGEGGAILTNNKNLYEYCKLLRSHGMVKDRALFSWKYKIDHLGYNFRLTDFQSILGRYQLKELKKKVDQRNKIAKFYNKKFKDRKNIIIPHEQKNNLNAFHLYILKINFKKLNISKENFFKRAFKLGLKLQQHYIPIYKFKYIKKYLLNRNLNFKNSEKYYNEAVSLPIHNNLSQKDLNKIVNIINKILWKKQSL